MLDTRGTFDPSRTTIQFRGAERHRIDIRNRDDVAQWCRRLGLTPMQLCSLIDRFGNEVATLQHAMRTK
jgi:hypothetical protein